MKTRKDWPEWHKNYENQHSSQSKRLALVQHHIVDILPSTNLRSFRILDICAGNGADLIPVLAQYPFKEKVSADFIEISEQLCRDARELAAEMSVGAINIIQDDASVVSTYENLEKYDLVLLCGVFGNIDPEDFDNLVSFLPQLMKDGGKVIWTVNLRDESLKDKICKAMKVSQLRELSLDHTDDNSYAVSVNQLESFTETSHVKEKLFTFIR